MTDESASRSWDLQHYYTGVDDRRIEADLGAAGEMAAQFRNRYRGRISADGLTATALAEALAAYEQLQRLSLKPYHYAYLQFAADSETEVHRQLLAKVREVLAGVTEQTLFFELEIVRIAEAAMTDLLADPAVAPYRHYLETVRAATPYTLAEEVEQVIRRKDLSGKEAFVQLFDETTAALRFNYRMPDAEAETEVSGEELLALLYHPERDTRRLAFTTYLEGHAGQAPVLTSCFNNLLLDHGREADLRGYPDLMTPTHLSSETEPQMVEQMMDVTEENYGLARRYFAIKKRLLGLETLENTDLYAPLSASPKQYAYPDACRLVLDSFAGFAPEIGSEAERLLVGGYVDVAPRPGKSGGAFCMGMLPGESPYVLLNYTGNLRDVSTLAHELGHAVHYSLSGRQNLFHYHAALPMAETASVFGEMLLTRRLLDNEADRQLKIALLCGKLEDMIATTFRQNVLTRFELAAHRLRGERLLAADDLCRLWLEENGKLFGDAVQMIDAYRWGWSYISHFIHARFYCYSYVFGELLVLALYQQYLQQGEAFVPAYLDLLKAGGSAAPAELVRRIGLDLSAPDFWQGGYRFMAGLLDELEVLVAGE